MGKLLEMAIAETAKLPEPEQEAVGAWILFTTVSVFIGTVSMALSRY